MSTTFNPALIALVGLLGAAQVQARSICYDRYGRAYRCLSTGSRIAIGVCVGVGVLLLLSCFGLMRRKKLQSQFKQYRPPPPGTMNTTASANPYANNPPPPSGTYGNYSGGFNGSNNGYGGYGNDVSAPPNSYQPQGQQGLSSQYYGNERAGAATDFKETPLSGRDNELADHSYEYRQAQESAASNGSPAPPGYEVPSGGYSAPPGPPPGNTQYSAPSGPPPGKN